MFDALDLLLQFSIYILAVISVHVNLADPKMMKNLALGVLLPVQEAVFAARRNPSPGWPESVYQLIGKS